jgi:hypothetical protein
MLVVISFLLFLSFFFFLDIICSSDTIEHYTTTSIRHTMRRK